MPEFIHSDYVPNSANVGNSAGTVESGTSAPVESGTIYIDGNKSIRELVIICAEQPVLTLIALVIIWFVSIMTVFWVTRRVKSCGDNAPKSKACKRTFDPETPQRIRNPQMKRESSDASDIGEADTDPPSGRYICRNGRVIGMIKSPDKKAIRYEDTTENDDELSTPEPTLDHDTSGHA